MAAKRFYVDRTDGQTGRKTQVGDGSKTISKAQELRQRMRAQQDLGSSNWFTTREGRK